MTVRLFSISHSCVVSAYRERYRQLLKVSGGELECRLLTPWHWRQYGKELELGNWREEPFTVLPKQPLHLPFGPHGLRNLLHFYPTLGQHLREFSPDIVEVWAEPQSLVAFQALALCRRLKPRPKFIFFSAQNLRRRYPCPLGWFAKTVLAEADHAWSMSAEVSAVLESLGYSGSRDELPLGYDPLQFRPTTTRAPGPIRIGFVGRLCKEKGVLDLCRAATGLAGAFELVVMGSGPLEDECRRGLVPLMDAGLARFTGAIPQDEVAREMARLDLLVVPSRTIPGVWKEQFGRVIVEAMACGVAVLGSRSGEIPVVIGRQDLLFDEGDTEGLRCLLQSFLDEPGALGPIRAKNLERAQREYSWESVAQRQWIRYQELQGRCSAVDCN